MTSSRAAEPLSPSALPPPATTQRVADAERLVFFLQYVGGDYAAAVRDGLVVDESEYRENREFVSIIRDRFAAIRDGLPKGEVTRMSSAIDELSQLVENRGDAKRVRAITESLIPEIVESVGLHAFPRRRPDTEAAAKLYAENCVPCHGPRGDGDGPRAKDLDPPPARFTDRGRMDSTAPYVFYNAITLGVDNTAMASFADGLSDQQRWDLAFYLWTFAPPQVGGPGEVHERPAVNLSLRDLATRSSTELAPELRRQADARGVSVDPAQAIAWASALRARPPLLSDAQERLARLRVDLARSLRLLEEGDFDGAADRVTSSYLSEFEPLEPEIDRHDAGVRKAFERDLIEFRTALRRSDRQAAIAAAGRLEQSVDRSAEMLSGAGSKSSGTKLWLAAGLLALSTAALVVLAGRKRRERAAPDRDRHDG